MREIVFDYKGEKLKRYDFNDNDVVNIDFNNSTIRVYPYSGNDRFLTYYSDKYIYTIEYLDSGDILVKRKLSRNSMVE